MIQQDVVNSLDTLLGMAASPDLNDTLLVAVELMDIVGQVFSNMALQSSTHNEVRESYALQVAVLFY